MIAKLLLFLLFTGLPRPNGLAMTGGESLRTNVKQSRGMDCFEALPLAMTKEERARNDEGDGGVMTMVRNAMM